MISRFFFAVSLLLAPAGLAGQVATVEPDTQEEAARDPDDVRGAARDAQAAFERLRLRRARVSFGSGGECDEYVGRFCTTYHEGEWYPRPEADEVVEARAELLLELDSLQRLSPGDGWILGQRVWYRAEGGNWDHALDTSRDCGAVEPWWCSALEGLSLHGLGRYRAALEAFEWALADMDPERAEAWRVPERAVDRDARRELRDWGEAGPEALSAGLSALWALADPLFLVEGNDRLTEHYARWTVSELKREARNPYGLRWADDLEELTVRHGWEIGWERIRSRLPTGPDGALGHKHPEGRDFMPTGSMLRDPVADEAEALIADRREPRSLYAPVYAPVLLPMESVLAVFPRGDHAYLVATAYLPEDTTFHAGHEHPRPWMEPGDQADVPDRIGLFALPVGGHEPLARSVGSGSEGALLLRLPPGEYVLSAESWSPAGRLSGRHRAGIRIDPLTPDVAGISDVLLLEGDAPAPASLEEALPRVLPRARIRPSDPLAIAWELSGLGFREETLEYAVSVERTDRNVFRRIGEFLGLAERPRALALSWQEPGPEHPGHEFRHLDLDLPPVDPGDYRITLVLRTAGRSDVVVTRDFEVVEP